MASLRNAKPSREVASKWGVGGCKGYRVGDDGWSNPARLARTEFELPQLILHVLYFALCELYFIELLFVKLQFRQNKEKESKASLP